MSFYRKITSLLQSSKTTVSFAEAEQALRWQQRQEDPGKFEYGEDGFSYPYKDGPEKIKWTEIERIVAYKEDRITFDEMCLDLFWKGQKWTITEETPGWYQFLKRLVTAFPTIPDNWDGQIAQPPFATSFTVLYERQD